MSDRRVQAASSTPETHNTAPDAPDADTRYGAWGFGNVPWFWGPRLRILLVMDGRVTVSWGDWDFGLGYVLKSLRAQFAWWVSIEITTAHRGDVEPVEIATWPVSITVGPNLVGFRFTQDGFDIDDYDQVWFFGDEPGLDGNDPKLPDSTILDPKYRPLDDDELLIIAEWMDRGGGVFAAGDHSILGASMCHRIPRVRRMRRWTHAQQVPPIDGDERNETLVHAPEGELDREGDRWPQRIYPVLRADDRWFGALGNFPHPIMCGRAGAIDHFPDHMHEGALFDNDEVRLNDPLDIPGYEHAEFPVPQPVVAASIDGLVAAADFFGDRPRPEIIAYGLTSHGDAPRRFPMVGVYDGEPVGVGRIVVDSTWHHWFSMNLAGLRKLSPGYYAAMQDYYRNIALWLATPAQRAAMLFAATWGALVGSHPGAFDPVMGIRGLGERVVDVIGRTAPQCLLDDLVATVAMLPRRAPREDSESRVWVWAPSREALNVSIVGGIASRLLDEAHLHINERAHGRVTEFNADAVRRLSIKGLEAGRRELLVGLAEGSEVYRGVDALIKKFEDRADFRDFPIDRIDDGQTEVESS
jgi:hypothetical protein